MPSNSTYTALHSYTGEEPTELTLKTNEQLTVLDECDGGDWWYGRSNETGKEGYFPREYVAIFDGGEAADGGGRERTISVRLSEAIDGGWKPPAPPRSRASIASSSSSSSTKNNADGGDEEFQVVVNDKLKWGGSGNNEDGPRVMSSTAPARSMKQKSLSILSLPPPPAPPRAAPAQPPAASRLNGSNTNTNTPAPAPAPVEVADKQPPPPPRRASGTVAANPLPSTPDKVKSVSRSNSQDQPPPPPRRASNPNAAVSPPAPSPAPAMAPAAAKAPEKPPPPPRTGSNSSLNGSQPPPPPRKDSSSPPGVVARPLPPPRGSSGRFNGATNEPVSPAVVAGASGDVNSGGSSPNAEIVRQPPPPPRRASGTMAANPPSSSPTSKDTQPPPPPRRPSAVAITPPAPASTAPAAVLPASPVKAVTTKRAPPKPFPVRGPSTKVALTVMPTPPPRVASPSPPPSASASSSPISSSPVSQDLIPPPPPLASNPSLKPSLSASPPPPPRADIKQPAPAPVSVPLRAPQAPPRSNSSVNKPVLSALTQSSTPTPLTPPAPAPKVSVKSTVTPVAPLSSAVQSAPAPPPPVVAKTLSTPPLSGSSAGVLVPPPTRASRSGSVTGSGASPPPFDRFASISKGIASGRGMVILPPVAVSVGGGGEDGGDGTTPPSHSHVRPISKANVKTPSLSIIEDPEDADTNDAVPPPPASRPTSTSVTRDRNYSTHSNLDEAIGESGGDPAKAFEAYKLKLKSCSIIKYAETHFAKVRTAGMVFKKEVPVSSLMTWNARVQKIPMLLATDIKEHGKTLEEMFKRVMIYMGDLTEKSKDKSSPVGANLKGFYSDFCVKVKKPEVVLKELFVFIIKQCNQNPSDDGCIRGFEILVQAVRAPVLPDAGFMDIIRKYIMDRRNLQSRIGGLCNVAFHNLLISEETRSNLGLLSKEEMQFAKTECIIQKSPFNCSIEQVLRYEHHLTNPLSLEDPLKLFSSNRWVPRIVKALVDVTRSLNGAKTAGIFRLASDKDTITSIKTEIEKHGYRMIIESIKNAPTTGKKRFKNMNALEALSDKSSIYDGILISDANESADLLKQWFRGLTDPIVPYEMYNQALKAGKGSDIRDTIAVFNSLMGANQACLDFLITYLVELLEDKDVTLMDEGNLALVFCPNLLRNMDVDPLKFATNADNEKRFVVALIEAKKRGLLLPA